MIAAAPAGKACHVTGVFGIPLSSAVKTSESPASSWVPAWRLTTAPARRDGGRARSTDFALASVRSGSVSNVPAALSEPMVGWIQSTAVSVVHELRGRKAAAVAGRAAAAVAMLAVVGAVTFAHFESPIHASREDQTAASPRPPSAAWALAYAVRATTHASHDGVPGEGPGGGVGVGPALHEHAENEPLRRHAMV
jgi:hypothetical protein